jgi:hypothetical protein
MSTRVRNRHGRKREPRWLPIAVLLQITADDVCCTATGLRTPPQPSGMPQLSSGQVGVHGPGAVPGSDGPLNPRRAASAPSTKTAPALAAAAKPRIPVTRSLLVRLPAIDSANRSNFVASIYPANSSYLKNRTNTNGFISRKRMYESLTYAVISQITYFRPAATSRSRKRPALRYTHRMHERRESC